MSENQNLIKIPFLDIFDKALERNDDRPTEPRVRIFASELSQSFYDRYHSMKGRTPTTPANAPAIRKMSVGNLFEDYVKITLYNIGLLLGEEESVMNTDFELMVSGRLDARYGGKINFKNVDLEKYKFLSFLGKVGDSVKKFAEDFPNLEISESLIEVKSTADYSFNRIIEERKPMEHHALQSFHYAYTTKLPVTILYFCKNTGRVASFDISPDDTYLLRLYKNDIEKMAWYLENDEVPPKESPIEFNGKKCSLNWKIQYSKYLTDYGFEQKQDYVDHYSKDIAAWNRVLGRFFDGSPMTDSNKKYIYEMIKAGVDLPKEMLATLKPQPPEPKAETKTKKVTDYQFEDGEVVEKEVEINVSEMSALDKLKSLD